LYEIDHNRPFGFTAFREHLTEQELRELEEEEEEEEEDNDDDENDEDYQERERGGEGIGEEGEGEWWKARGEEDVEVGSKRRGRDWLLAREEHDDEEGSKEEEVERGKSGMSNGVLLAGLQGDEEGDVDVPVL